MAFEWMNHSCMFVSTLGPAECAAWAQAWFTLIGLAVAIAVAAEPARLARKAARRVRVEQLEFSYELVREGAEAVEKALAQLDHLPAHVEVFGFEQALPARAATLLQALSQPLPAEAAREILAVRRAVLMVSELLSLAREKHISRAAFAVHFDEVRQVVQLAKTRLEARLEQARREA